MSLFDPYTENWPEEIQARMKKIMKLVEEEFPDAQAMVKYNMPGYERNGNLIHFAAYQYHIGLYPVPTDDKELSPKLAPYLSGKGTMQLPHGQPLPISLILEVIRFNARRLEQKKKV